MSTKREKSSRGLSKIRKACMETLEQRMMFAADPVISEFMASNATTLLSKATNSYNDWLEIHNTDPANAIDLSGWYLTNKLSKPKTFKIPTGTTIAANGYLVVFTSSAVGAGGYLATPGGGTELFSTFNLGASGDTIALVKPDGLTVVSQYTWSASPPIGGIGPQQTDISYGTINQTSLVGPSAPVHVFLPTDNSLGSTWTSTSFNDSSWISGTDGVGYKTDGSFSSVIGTNIQTQMQNKSADAYVRVAFNVTDPSQLTALDLNMQFQDGFVAYINGVEVARKNTPSSVTWNTLASKAIANGANGLPPAVDFDISSNLGLLHTGTNVLSIQGLNDKIGSTDFLINPKLTATTKTPSTGYLNTPTPGAANVAGVSGFVSDLQFDHAAGLYGSPFTLNISTDTAGATIIYTTDGSAPTLAHGTVYTGAIAIGQGSRATTIIRAAAFAPGMQATDVSTNSYIFTSDVAGQTGSSLDQSAFPPTWNTNTADYDVDPTVSQSATYGPNFQKDLTAVPTISIVMDPSDLFDPSTGIYSNPLQDGDAWKRGGSVEIINPDGTINTQTNADITMEGGGSRDPNNSPKHSFRLFFNGDDGSPTKFHDQFFPDTTVDSFNTLVIHAVFNNTWIQSTAAQQRRADYIKDQFAHDTALAMGDPSSHGQFMQLYVNGVYWGLYNPLERPDASWAASYFGGNSDDWDVVHDQALSDGNLTRWNQMFAIADSTTLTGDQKFQQLKSYVDYKSLADYIILMTYTSNNDWGFHNWYAGADRVGLANGDATFKFFQWDNERSLEGVNDNNININADLSPSGLFQQLRTSSDFRQIFADRVQQYMFNGGALTPGASTARYLTRANQIKDAVIGESARWGDYRKQPGYTLVDWQKEVDRLTLGTSSYFAQRTNVVLAQYRAAGLFAGTTLDAPVFNQVGGAYTAGFQLTITKTPNTVGTIYYTLDGTDPRAEGGALNSTAVAYAGAITLSGDVHVQSRVYDGTNWSALTDGTFISTSSPQLRITEISYHPQAPSGSTFANDDFEFIELENIGPGALNLSNYAISGGISYVFGNQTLAAGQHTVIVSNLAAFQSMYGTGVNVAGVYTGNLSNSSAELKLTGPVKQTILDFFYNDSWFPVTDGDGNTLVINNPNDNPNNWGTASSWHASYDINGTPGADELPPSQRGVVVSELLSNPSSGDANGDRVELHNTGNTAIDVNGWFLSDDASSPQKYRINSNGGTINTVIAAGGYLVLTEAANFGNASDPGTITPFSFSKDGDSVVLSAAGSEGLLGYRDKEKFAGSDVNTPFELYTASDGTTDFVAETTSTFGSDNAAPVVGPIVINEIMYDPAGTDDEFIELKNISGSDVSLFDAANPANTWQLTNGVAFTFPATHVNPTPDTPNPVIAAGGLAIIVPSTITAAAFRAKYGIAANVAIFSGYTGALNNAGETLELSRPGTPETDGTIPLIVVDRINYSPLAPWPTSAKGTGPSLSRVLPTAYGNDPSNWTAGPNKGTPGLDNSNSNQAPLVSAGSAQVVTLPTKTVNLHGTAVDDGLPNPPASLTTTWSVLTGNAANVSFGNASALNTTATFTAGGVYTLQLSAFDGVYTSTSTVKITVNTAPTSNAGADQYIPFAPLGQTTSATLNGSASDADALPGSLSTQWTVVSSPIGATVTFDNANALNAKASFSTSGVYTLRLTANDGAASTTDDMVVTIDHAPIVNAGGNAFIVTPSTQYALQGIVTDDNLPTAPGFIPPVTTSWSQIDGPGTATFTNASNPKTAVTLTAVGDYTLRLTATEGSITTYDDIVVSVVTNPIQVAGLNFNAVANTSFTGQVASFQYVDPNAPIGNFSASINWGDGTTSAGVLSVDATAGFDVAGTHTYTSAGSKPVVITISDTANESNTGSATATVTAAAPVVTAGNGASINEGGTFTGSGSFTDINPGPWTATVDYGDGTGVAALAFDANTHAFNLSHVYKDNGAYTVTVAVTNTATAQTTSANTTSQVTVADVAPTVGVFSTTPITSGSTFTSSGSFTDPGVLDTFTATVNYGDGTGPQALSLNGNNFSLSHVYTAAGNFTVTVAVTDNASLTGSNSASELVNGVTNGNGLVSEYTFDGSGADLTGTNPGTLLNSPTFVTGKVGQAISLNGSNQSVLINDSASLNPTTAITLSAWINATDWTGNHRILQKGNKDNQYRLLAESGVLKFDLKNVGVVSTTLPAASSTNAASAWHLITGTYDGAKMTLYVDGVAVSTLAVTGAIATTADALQIGNKNGSTRATDSFHGLLDDVRIYSRALSSAEVQSLFSGTTVTQTLTSITISPNPVSVTAGATQTFTATAKDQNGNSMTAPITWSTTAGSITQAGVFTAPTSGTSATITATSGSIFGTSAVTITPAANAAPTIATASAATPSPVTGKTASLSVLGADDAGEANLTYTWAATTLPQGAATPTFAVNATNGAKNTTATFSAAGNYAFTVTVKDAAGLTATNTVNVTVNQTLTSITVSPSGAAVQAGATQQYTAAGLDQFGAAMSVTPTWSATGGTISGTGLFTAGNTGGGFTVTATSGAVVGSTAVMVTLAANAAPTIATAAAATPSPVTGKTGSLSVLGDDDAGEANLIYTWAATTLPQGAATPTFSANATNGAKNTVATFTKAGSYAFTVTVKDAGGLTATSTVNVTVNQALTSITVSPSGASVQAGATQQYTAAGVDQFGSAMTIAPTWSALGGTISAGGLFTAGSSAGGFTVTATVGSITGTATGTVTAAQSGSVFTGQGDIGAVGLAGTSSVNAGAYSVTGAGADIWGAADGLHFVYVPVTGDVQIIARVASEGNSNTSAKAGVMIRSTLDANSPEALVAVTAATDVTFIRRTAVGGSSVNTTNKLVGIPYWVKLVRTGSNFTAFQSADGVAWTKIGATAAITMNATVYVGLAVTSHNVKVLNTAAFDHVTVAPITNVAMKGSALATTTAAGSSALNAIDGSTSTSWTSASAGTQSLTLDLGSIKSIARVNLTWGTTFAKAYTLQISGDGSTWTTIYTNVKGTGGVIDLSGLSSSGRFVRMSATSGVSSSYMVSELAVFAS